MIKKQCFIVSGKEHDLTVLLEKESRWNIIRVRSQKQVIAKAKHGDFVLFAADGYPDQCVRLDEELWEWLARSGVRAYVEYPDAVPCIGSAEIRQMSRLERGWVCGVKRLPDALVNIGASVISAFPAEGGWVRVGKFAGYDRMAFPVGDTPTEAFLFEAPHGNILVAGAPLMNFNVGRFAPQESWRVIWEEILKWLSKDDTLTLPALAPLCGPAFDAEVDLPEHAQRSAVRASLQWFHDARMLLGPQHEALYHSIDTDGCLSSDLWGAGDGSAGVLEGYISEINHEGRQPTRCWRRADCTAEVAGAFALGARLGERGADEAVAGNLLDWLYNDSPMVKGDRADPGHPAFGLIGWHDRPRYGAFNHADGWDIYYGDDNARVILGSIMCAGALQEDRWLVPLVRCILANLRTSGQHGLKENAISNSDLSRNGWTPYFLNSSADSKWISPHYQCYLSACYLWLYRQTGDELLLQRGEDGIRILMEAYPQRWRWTNGLQQERARMLLPLAWLFRISGNSRHRAWLDAVSQDLLEHQTSCGAIREVLADTHGKYGPPSRHEDYGEREASLLQREGDPVADLLYTCNFAFLGLHEAAAATGDERYAKASDSLAEFLMRVQSHSLRSDLSGLWYRAFDFQRWEVWASDADSGWGAWCVETGWTQAWITAVLAMRELNVSLWEIYQPTNIKTIYEHEKNHYFQPSCPPV